MSLQENQSPISVNTHRADDDEMKSVLFGLVCSLLLSPFTFQITQSDSSIFGSDLSACVLTIFVAVIIAFSTHYLLKRNCHIIQRLDKQQKLLFNAFSSNPALKDASPNKGREAQYQRRKIDPKYFKPKFIIHELITFWDTTYSVITWGSFYVIGGTIVVTERLAQKIKTKCAREQQGSTYQSGHRERNDSSFSYSSSASGANDNSFGSTKTPLRRVASWTKKSFSSAKKRLAKFANSTTILEITGHDQQSLNQQRVWIGPRNQSRAMRQSINKRKLVESIPGVLMSMHSFLACSTDLRSILE